MSLQTQYAASQDPLFSQRVMMAVLTTATQVYNEATTLSVTLAGGTAVTSLPLAVALPAAIPAGRVIDVDGDAFVVSNPGAANGATSIPVASQAPSITRLAGTPVSPPTVAGHFTRAVFASRILNLPLQYAQVFAFACAAQGLDNSATDAAISNAVSSVWNVLAGA